MTGIALDQDDTNLFESVSNHFFRPWNAIYLYQNLGSHFTINMPINLIIAFCISIAAVYANKMEQNYT